MDDKIEIDKRELVALLFKLDNFGDNLIGQGNQYKSLVSGLRKEYLFSKRKDMK